MRGAKLNPRAGQARVRSRPAWPAAQPRGKVWKPFHGFHSLSVLARRGVPMSPEPLHGQAQKGAAQGLAHLLHAAGRDTIDAAVAQPLGVEQQGHLPVDDHG